MTLTSVKNTVVGVGDMKALQAEAGRIVTFALGSCVAVSLFDRQARFAALLHAMLPSVRYATERTRDRQWMFVDTGVPEMFRAAYQQGADKARLQVVVAGGACVRMASTSDMFQIGAKNVAMVRALLEKNGVPVSTWHIGGSHARTLSLDVGTGEVALEIAGERIEL